MSPVPDKPDKMPSAVEFEPPLACVRRILKHSLPSSTNVGKDASSAFARACGIFIIYLTACSNDFAREHKRQTITANDVLAAIQELDFGDFMPEMTTFLENYRKTEKNKKDAKAAAKKEKEDEGSHNDDEEDEEAEPSKKRTASLDESTPAAKRAKTDDNDDDDGEAGDVGGSSEMAEQQQQPVAEVVEATAVQADVETKAEEAANDSHPAEAVAEPTES